MQNQCLNEQNISQQIQKFIKFLQSLEYTKNADRKMLAVIQTNFQTFKKNIQKLQVSQNTLQLFNELNLKYTYVLKDFLENQENWDNFEENLNLIKELNKQKIVTQQKTQQNDSSWQIFENNIQKFINKYRPKNDILIDSIREMEESELEKFLQKIEKTLFLVQQFESEEDKTTLLLNKIDYLNEQIPKLQNIKDLKLQRKQNQIDKLIDDLNELNVNHEKWVNFKEKIIKLINQEQLSYSIEQTEQDFSMLENYQTPKQFYHLQHSQIQHMQEEDDNSQRNQQNLTLNTSFEEENNPKTIQDEDINRKVKINYQQDNDSVDTDVKEDKKDNYFETNSDKKLLLSFKQSNDQPNLDQQSVDKQTEEEQELQESFDFHNFDSEQMKKTFDSNNMLTKNPEIFIDNPEEFKKQQENKKKVSKAKQKYSNILDMIDNITTQTFFQQTFTIKYTDSNFPPMILSILDRFDTDKYLENYIQWRRLSSIVTKSYKIYFDNKSLKLEQSQFSNDQLVTIIQAMSKFPFLSDYFIENYDTTEGKFTLNSFTENMQIHLDDFLPVLYNDFTSGDIENFQLAFLKPSVNTNQVNFFVPVLEKYCAKIFGSYSSLQNQDFFSLIKIFSSIQEKYNLTQIQSQKQNQQKYFFNNIDFDIAFQIIFLIDHKKTLYYIDKVYINKKDILMSETKIKNSYTINEYTFKELLTFFNTLIICNFDFEIEEQLIQLNLIINMGIFYFSTWLANRYPNIQKTYDTETQPIIDHLYLDLNGVLHRCAKEQSSVFKNLISSKDMEAIFVDILNYTNYLINLVRPKKSIFIAVDGVAPFAKQIDQRNRRYRSVKDSKDLDEFMINELGICPEAVNFKTNSISPGTDFMSQLNKHLNFFIQQKINEDEEWRKLKVYFSDGNVPGEGEHKITKQIRAYKQSQEFDVNDTHCIYGNDSDLVLLSLVTHLPFCVVLREQREGFQKYSTYSSTDRSKSKSKMENLYINLLREYLELEYQEYLKAYFDLDRIIDDFILVSFFIGNDFMHQLFCMNLKFGNFDEFLDNLKEYYYETEKKLIQQKIVDKDKLYLTNKCQINWKNFQNFIKRLLHFDKKMVQSTLGDFNKRMKELEREKVYASMIHQTKKDTEIIEDEEEDDQDQQYKKVNIRKLTEEYGEDKEDDCNNKKQNNQTNDLDLKQHDIEYKNQYLKVVDVKNKLRKFVDLYKNNGNKQGSIPEYKKFYYIDLVHLKSDNLQKNIDDLCYEYLKGCDFVLKYYYLGVQCQEWFFPSKGSPLLSDLHFYLANKFDLKQFQYSDTQPISPMQQLLYILPKQSLCLLPQSLKNSALDTQSDINQFYPEEFDILPFDRHRVYTWSPTIEPVDQEKMKNFVKNFDWNNQLTKEQLETNELHKLKLYQYDVSQKYHIKSTLTGFDDTQNAKIKETFVDETEIDEKTIKDDNFYESSIQRFPTFKVFKNLKIYAELKRDRYTFYFLIDEQTIKSYVTKQKFSLKKFLSKNKSQVYLDPIYGKAYELINSSKITQKQLQKDNQDFIQNVEDHCFKQGFVFQKPNPLYKEKALNVFQVQPFVYSHYVDNNTKEFIHATNQRNTLSFLSFQISLQKQYPSLFQFENKSVNKQKHLQKKLAIDLMTGNLYFLKKNFSVDNPQSYNLVRQNYRVQNIKKKSRLDNLLLVTQKFLEQLGLKKEESYVLWIVLDTLKIRTNKQESNSLILGDIYDIGLCFMNVLDTHIQKWKTVPDMIQIYQRQNNDSLFDCTYKSAKQKKFKKKFEYNIYLTEAGAKAVLEYFEENKDIINFLKSKLKYDQLLQDYIIPNTYKGFMVKDIKFTDQQEQSLNMRLFKLYANNMKKNHTNLLLNDSLSLSYDIEVVKQLATESLETDQNDQKIKSTASLIVNTNNKFVIWPQLKDNPSYHKLGDRIVFVNNHSTCVKFGELGTIIGVFTNKIEILFDKPFLGATNLNGRCPNFRGGIVDFFDVFNLSQWRDKIELDSRNTQKSWSGDFDIFQLISAIKNEQTNIINQKNFKTCVQLIKI